MRKGKRKINQKHANRVLINEDIREDEVRVIDADGSNLGVISRNKAISKAHAAGLDLVMVSDSAKPPITKITDYGKYVYNLSKKAKEVRAKAHTTETKGIQIKVTTGEGDLTVKAKRIAEWLEEGQRVKIELFLSGRYKYMEATFLTERLERFLKIIPFDFKIADPIKKAPKGFSVIIEPVKKK